MSKYGNRLKKAYETIDSNNSYPIAEAVKIIKDAATTKFDETVEVAINLGVDPKHADQMVRGTVTLPHGTGKALKVAVFAKGDKAKEAEAAGADLVGADDLAEKIQKGDIDFDRCIATPDMMAVVGKLGKIFGPKGLKPVSAMLATLSDTMCPEIFGYLTQKVPPNPQHTLLSVISRSSSPETLPSSARGCP